eukprot:2271397-Rhodomonas_salina.1
MMIPAAPIASKLHLQVLLHWQPDGSEESGVKVSRAERRRGLRTHRRAGSGRGIHQEKITHIVCCTFQKIANPGHDPQ